VKNAQHNAAVQRPDRSEGHNPVGSTNSVVCFILDRSANTRSVEFSADGPSILARHTQIALSALKYDGDTFQDEIAPYASRRESVRQRAATGRKAPRTGGAM
jgi:hypothetical protein